MKAKCDELLSNLAFKFKLRRYIWAEVFSRCSTGYEEDSLNVFSNDEHPHYQKLAVSQYLSHMSPDLLGLRGRGLHSSTFQLNLSTFADVLGGFRDKNGSG